MDRTRQNEFDFIRFNHLNKNKLSVYIIVFVVFATPSFSLEQRFQYNSGFILSTPLSLDFYQ